MSEEKENIDCKLFSKEGLTPSGNTINFMQGYGDLYNFWYSLPYASMNLDNVKLHQVKFLEDLMNEFRVYKKIDKAKNESDYKAKDLYLILLGNTKKTVNDIPLKSPTDRYNEKIYLHAKILFNLSE